MRAYETEGVARAQSNLKASKERNAQQQRKNQAARVIRGYNINNGNKNKFINNLKTTKTQQNIKIIQERAKTIHNAAVTNKKMAAKAAKKAEAQARKEKERQEAEARTRKLKANKQAAEAALNAEKQKAREAIAGYTLYDWQAKGFLTKIKAAKKSDQLQKIQREAKGIHNKTVKNRAANAAKKAKAANAAAKAAKNRQSAALRKRLKTNMTSTITEPKNPTRRPVAKK
jgi:colicin import membrane protein